MKNSIDNWGFSIAKRSQKNLRLTSAPKEEESGTFNIAPLVNISVEFLPKRVLLRFIGAWRWFYKKSFKANWRGNSWTIYFYSTAKKVDCGEFGVDISKIKFELPLELVFPRLKCFRNELLKIFQLSISMNIVKRFHQKIQVLQLFQN